MKNVKLGDTFIGDSNPTYIIAEIGGNYLNFQEAKLLIDLAQSTGVDAVKLQTYRADTITSKKAVYDMPNVGHASQHELFKKYEIDFSLHKDIWDYCREKKIFVFSTPSHMQDVELLEKLECQTYKIGSDDAYNIPFLEEISALGKPIILSTGMCTINEVRESVSAMLAMGNSDIVLLQCVTNYPAEPEHQNLRCMQSMKNEFCLPVGFSDHTIGTVCSIAAAALGANIIEKHFTNNKKNEGPDHILSADPVEMREIVNSVRIIESALGDGLKRPSEGEKTTRLNNRKGIISTIDIPEGTTIKEEMVAIKRPGLGIMPKYYNEIIGRTAKTDIEAEEPILWNHV